MFSPRLISYVTRSHTGERGDDAMGGIPMHRGLGPHVRGESEKIRGLGTIGAPETFGHGGAGTSMVASSFLFAAMAALIKAAAKTVPTAEVVFVRNLVHAAID